VKHLVAYVAENRQGLHDASGAFVPMAREYIGHWGREDCEVFPITTIGKGTASARRWQFSALCDKLADEGRQFDAFAFFGHGTFYSIQLGYQRQHVGELASALSIVLKTHSKCILYACSTAENDVKDNRVDDLGAASAGGFADKLRSSLVEIGLDCDVFGHKTAGHTVFNPYWARFSADCASVGGEWVIRPRSEYWEEWKLALKSSELAFEFPWYSRAALREWLTEYAHQKKIDAYTGYDS